MNSDLLIRACWDQTQSTCQKYIHSYFQQIKEAISIGPQYSLSSAIQLGPGCQRMSPSATDEGWYSPKRPYSTLVKDRVSIRSAISILSCNICIKTILRIFIERHHCHHSWNKGHLQCTNLPCMGDGTHVSIQKIKYSRYYATLMWYYVTQYIINNTQKYVILA